MKILMAYFHKYALNEFVETGTHLGATLAYLAYDKNVIAQVLSWPIAIINKQKIALNHTLTSTYCMATVPCCYQHSSSRHCSG